MAMEFWGVEVKSGEPFQVSPEPGTVLHLSQASIGEVKKDKGSETVNLFVKLDDKKLVLGTLFTDKLPQQQFDLIFDKDFELSHNWKSGSVYFYGYMAPSQDYDDEDGEVGFPGEFGSESESDESEEEDEKIVANNGKPDDSKAKKEKPAPAVKANAAKDSAAGKQKVKIVEPSKDAKDEDDEDDSEDDESNDDFGSDDSMDEDEVDESDSEDEDESDEDEETPKKDVTGKKRPAESAIKTPVPDKKAKVSTPQKTDGKKGGVHVATPHPSKQAGKTPANKSTQQSPKSSGSFSCGTCKKTFGSDNALQSHSKAKHSGK